MTEAIPSEGESLGGPPAASEADRASPLDAAQASASSAAEARAPPAERRPQGEEWVQPRRIAVIVAFALSLALFLGTGARLWRLGSALPIAGATSLIAGILEVPPLLLFVAGLERRTMRTSPLLLLTAAGGFTAYFVGGAVGLTSPTTLGGAVIALVLFLMVGHPAAEKRKRRLRRVHRWSRNASLLGIVLLLLAFGLYVSYNGSPAVAPIAGVKLDHTEVLAPGGSYNFTTTGAPGDELYLLIAASNSTAGVAATYLDHNGNPVSASVLAGSAQVPGFLPFSLQNGGGVFIVWITYPGTSSGPASVWVNYTSGDIPAGTVALGAATVPSGWTGFILVIVGTTLWVVTRMPRPPPPSPEGGPPLSPETPPVPATGTGPPEKVESPLPLEGEGDGTPSKSATALTVEGRLEEGESSDEGKTKPPDVEIDSSSATSK
ncbi:MAG: hypothetical protein KGJ23_02980 [Euryarchaeota archaeon]|nr:hypothetical protein [Euryarchaeota archaeon]MDE1835562.1 hypothetical protein [Euryarchaeota archaeon]MDE1878910.1 hypothetical protein [Euryarchaeota archaeon]MDE2043816.1 hypothetical protein [Thermoplasmata archaeon]